MYEASFGLKRRPFAATPDASCFLSSDPIRAALDEIVVCVEHGQGIAVLTAPAGAGKTLLCERLRCELDDRYETVFLRHSSFLTRRALLQTILCELNSPYHHPSEQELRLELLPAIRALQPKREALVLICDESHQLSDSLLEELRILADFSESGRPLVRLVLVGQLSLEEKLAYPSLDAFNQRIRAHVSLSTFDHAASLDYIDYRLTWAGGRTNETFTPQALDLIAKVSDGIPRCINQLADHTLLLAFVAEQRPAGEELVREALSDLRQLPLHWNEPPQSLSTDYSRKIDDDSIFSQSPTNTDLDSTEILEDVKIDRTSSFEPDSDLDDRQQYHDRSAESVADSSPLTFDDFVTVESEAFQQTNLVDIDSDDWRHTLELFNSSISNHDSVDSDPQQSEKVSFQSAISHATIDRQSAGDFQEEIVVDRYAAIDAGLEPPVSTPWDTSNPIEVHFDQVPVDGPCLLSTSLVSSCDATVDQSDSNNEVPIDQDEREVPDWEGTFSLYANGPVPEVVPIGRRTIGFDMADVNSTDSTDQPSGTDAVSSESLLQAIRREVDHLATSVGRQSDGTSVNDTSVDDTIEDAWESVETPQPEPKAEARPFQYLFSKLRRKQQGLS